MKSKNTLMILMLLGLVMQSCISQNDPYAGLDPAGEARTRNRIGDKQLAQLPRTIGVDELKALWGQAEGQPGPRFTYRCDDHEDQFFWVYYRREDETSKDSRWIVDRIVRADRIEEGGMIVWPANYTAPPEPKIESDTATQPGDKPPAEGSTLIPTVKGWPPVAGGRPLAFAIK